MIKEVYCTSTLNFTKNNERTDQQLIMRETHVEASMPTLVFQPFCTLSEQHWRPTNPGHSGTNHNERCHIGILWVFAGVHNWEQKSDANRRAHESLLHHSSDFSGGGHVGWNFIAHYFLGWGNVYGPMITPDSNFAISWQGADSIH